MNDKEKIIDLILDHLEQINIVKVKTINNEKNYILSDEFKSYIKNALCDEGIKSAPNPLISAIILTYLYCTQDLKHIYELEQVTEVIYNLYKMTDDHPTPSEDFVSEKET